MDVHLEDIKPGARISGLTPDEAVEIVSVSWVGSDTLTVIFRTSSGESQSELYSGMTSHVLPCQKLGGLGLLRRTESCSG